MNDRQAFGTNDATPTNGHGKMKIVYTIVERNNGRSFWTRVGVAFTNADGSMNLKLDAVPVNGTLQVREWEPRDARDDGSRDSRDSDPIGPPRDRRPAKAEPRPFAEAV
ncbi:MAG: hypothetical protein U0169_12355 [Polyangiaceae bacterium]